MSEGEHSYIAKNTFGLSIKFSFIWRKEEFVFMISDLVSQIYDFILELKMVFIKHFQGFMLSFMLRNE